MNIRYVLFVCVFGCLVMCGCENTASAPSQNPENSSADVWTRSMYGVNNISACGIIVKTGEALGWEIDDYTLSSVSLKNSWDRYSLSVRINIGNDVMKLEVISAIGLRYDAVAGTIHRKARNLMYELLRDVEQEVVNVSKLDVQAVRCSVENRIISVAKNRTLQSVVEAVCIKHGIDLEAIAENDYNASYRLVDGKQIKVRIKLNGISFSILTDEDLNDPKLVIESNALINFLAFEIEKYADLQVYENRKQEARRIKEDKRRHEDMRIMRRAAIWGF